MNDAQKKKFQEATKGVDLTNDEKKALVAYYAAAEDLECIENMEQSLFTFLVREKMREWGWMQSNGVT